MDLDALLRRTPVVPFAPGTRIPWDDPEFSARMLREHLSQLHDRASRREAIIDRQVAWIHQAILGGEPSRILDLGCGPGLYTSRLARLGHSCVGIDFSPASIAHANAVATEDQLDCTYELEDLRSADLGSGFDAVTMLFGEFNTLAPEDAAALLERTRSALNGSGHLLLELHVEDYVRALGEEPPSWSAQEAGLFSDRPHLTLRESAWHEKAEAATERYFVFSDDHPPAIYTQTTKAYSDAQLDAMLERADLHATGRYESLTGDEESEAELFGLIAEPRS